MPTFHLLENITIGARQRKNDPGSAEIESLADSIARDGLINPICVLRTEPGKGQLIAGWRRFNAITLLHRKKIPFVHETLQVSPGCIPVTVITNSDALHLLRMEFSENKERVQLNWIEENDALALIAEAEKTSDPASTQISLAEGLAKQSGLTTRTVANQISRAVQLKAAMELNPELAKARTVQEAHKMLTRQRHDSLEAELTKRQLAKAETDSGQKQQWHLHHGDCRDVLADLPSDSIDLVLVDPPYGKDIDKMKYAPGQLHRYDDDLAGALDLGQFILSEGWRLTKSRANLFMFCDWENYAVLRTASQRFGWDPWFRPIIWNKSITEGAAPWGRQGFLNTYECLLWCTKGQQGIKGPLPDVLYSQKVGVVNRDHAAEKPVELLLQLIRVSTEPSGVVLDPCAGSGSTLDAALRLRRQAIGVELDEAYYNRAMSRLGQLSTALASNPKLAVA